MKEKLVAFFDNKATWVTFGVIAGTWFGGDVAAGVGALGQFVMAVL